MSVEFDTPANRVIAQQQPKNQFRVNTTLADIAFLRQMSVQGRLVFFQQLITSTTPLQITPSNGTTFFFYRASSVTGSSVTNATVSIVNDGQVRETFIVPRITTGESSSPHTSEFIDSLVGDGTKVFEITSDVATSIRTSVFGWNENTSRIRDVAT